MNQQPLPWRPLLVELSAEFADWTVFKHLDRALAGKGDLDAAAPRRDWDAITAKVQDWFSESRPGRVVIPCDHVTDVRLILLLDPDRLPVVDEIDLLSVSSLKGAPWARAEDLAALSAVGPDGRVLRPGAEALILALMYGLDYRGNVRVPGRERPAVSHGVRQDALGARLAAQRLLPRAAHPWSKRLANTLVSDPDGHHKSTALVMALVASAVAHPVHLMSRVAFRSRRPCVVADLALHRGRRLAPADFDAFLAEASVAHQLLGTASVPV